MQDAGWYSHDFRVSPNETQQLVDEWGRFIPVPERFPSSAGGLGLAPLSTRLRSMGLKLGVHQCRGIPRAAVQLNTPILGSTAHARDVAICDGFPQAPFTCTLNFSHPAAGAYYRSVVHLYEEWSLQFIKVDFIFGQDKFIFWPDIEAMAAALNASASHEFVLSISPGKNATEHSVNRALGLGAQMVRVTKDCWDVWCVDSASTRRSFAHHVVSNVQGCRRNGTL